MPKVITAGSELANHWYEEVELQGAYKGTWTKSDSGRMLVSFIELTSPAGPVWVDLFDRPEDEARQFDGKTVCAIGQIQPPLDETQPLHQAQRDNLPALVSIRAIRALD